MVDIECSVRASRQLIGVQDGSGWPVGVNSANGGASKKDGSRTLNHHVGIM